MPKQKTHSAASKKFKVTKTGKVLRRKAYSSHLLGKKSSARKRPYSLDHEMTGRDKKNILRRLGR